MQRMRIDMIRKSAEAPEHLMRVIADYIPDHAAAMHQPPSLVDIGLDLPPPAALQRRAHAPPPVYDMGGLIPPVNASTVLASVNEKMNVKVAAELGTMGAQHNGRPLTQGMRSVNPLENSMAAESVFIYPNGRELQRNRSMPTAGAGAGASRMSALAAAMDPNDLPFKSLEIQQQ